VEKDENKINEEKGYLQGIFPRGIFYV